jgi:hypothetical protein
MVYKKEDFRNDIGTLQIEGFKLKSAVQAYLFVRKKPSRTETITVSYKDYAPHGFYIAGVSAEIYLNEIEDILTPILSKHGVKEVFQSTIGKSFQGITGVNYDAFNIEINSEQAFSEVIIEVKKIVNQFAFPFFDKYNSLQRIADFLVDKKPEEIVPYIQGPILLPKTTLILREAGHSEYRKRLNEFFIVLKQYAEKKESYKPFLNVFVDLFSEDLMI